jgi:hypothetical protein
LAGFDDQRALLIAAGTVESEIEATEVFHAAAPEQIGVWIAPDASHTGAFQSYPDEWERRVVDFLDDTLQPA